jgi:hypothetical protein
MSEPLTDWGLKQVEEHGLQEHAFALLLFSLVGFALGWFTNVLKTRREIQKLKAEIRSANGANLEKLATLREKSNSKRETLNLAMTALRDGIADGKKTPTEIQALRDEMCNIYHVEYIPSVSNYVEMIPALVEKQECFIRAKTELIPGLQMTCAFLKMVNMEEMLAKSDTSCRFLVRKEARDGFLDRVYVLVPWWRIRVRRKLGAIRKETDKYVRD